MSLPHFSVCHCSYLHKTIFASILNARDSCFFLNLIIRTSTDATSLELLINQLFLLCREKNSSQLIFLQLISLYDRIILRSINYEG
jgi:hypothetical protein